MQKRPLINGGVGKASAKPFRLHQGYFFHCHGDRRDCEKNFVSGDDLPPQSDMGLKGTGFDGKARMTEGILQLRRQTGKGGGILHTCPPQISEPTASADSKRKGIG